MNVHESKGGFNDGNKVNIIKDLGTNPGIN